MPSVGSSVATATAAASTSFVPDLRSVLVTCFKSLFPLWVVSQLFTKSAPLESEGLEERIEILPMAETTEEVTVVTVEKMALPLRRFIREMADREDALPEMSFVMMLVCWMMQRLCCRRQRPGRGAISNSRNSQAGELLPGGRLVVNFHDDPGWDHSRLFLWPIDANTWIVLTPDGVKYAETFSDYSKMRVPPIGEGDTPEIGSVVSSRG